MQFPKLKNSMFIALALLTWPVISHAAKPYEWATLGPNCIGVTIPGMEQFIVDAKEWEEFQLKTQTEINVLANQTCPNYLQSANGAKAMSPTESKKITLEEYIADHTHTFNDAGDSTGRARKGDAYLASKFNHIAAIHASGGFDFSSTLCGQTINSGREHYAKIIKKIETMSAATGKQCTGLAEKISELGPDPSRPAIRYGKGNAIAGSSENPESSITGNIENEKVVSGETNKVKGELGLPNAKNLAAKKLGTSATSTSEKNSSVTEAGGSFTNGTGFEYSSEMATISSSVEPQEGNTTAGSESRSSVRAQGNSTSDAGFANRRPASPADYGALSLQSSLNGKATRSANLAANGENGLVNSEPVPLENEDRARFLREFEGKQNPENSALEKTLFERISKRYRSLSGGL